jgi:hypothetical protein
MFSTRHKLTKEKITLSSAIVPGQYPMIDTIFELTHTRFLWTLLLTAAILLHLEILSPPLDSSEEHIQASKEYEEG